MKTERLLGTIGYGECTVLAVILIVLIFSSLTSCCEGGSNARPGEVVNGYIQPAKISRNIEAYPIQYDGHRYVLFHVRNSDHQISAIHDPGCECQRKKTESIW